MWFCFCSALLGPDCRRVLIVKASLRPHIAFKQIEELVWPDLVWFVRNLVTRVVYLKESSRSKYRRESSFRFSLVDIQPRNVLKSTLNWAAPYSLQKLGIKSNFQKLIMKKLLWKMNFGFSPPKLKLWRADVLEPSFAKGFDCDSADGLLQIHSHLSDSPEHRG